VSAVFEERRAYTERVFAKLSQSLQETLRERQAAVIGDHTCVYATGSCGRGEMGPRSDLDAYVVGRGDRSEEDSEFLQDAIRRANAQADLPPLDGGGRHTKPIAAETLIDRLGSPEDDTSEDGAFTKRMLLLLESRVMIGESAYNSVIDDVVGAYWQNAELHRQNYQPFVLVNDIVRWWRIVLLNHESRLREREQKLQRDASLSDAARGELLLAERRYRSYKMRLARCMTCFSALTYLLALVPTDQSHVSTSDIRTMVGLQPLERIAKLPELVDGCGFVPEILSAYGQFLERTEPGKEAFLDQLRSDRAWGREVTMEGSHFTELVFKLVETLGGGRRLHRHMLV